MSEEHERQAYWDDKDLFIISIALTLYSVIIFRIVKNVLLYLAPMWWILNTRLVVFIRDILWHKFVGGKRLTGDQKHHKMNQLNAQM